MAEYVNGYVEGGQVVLLRREGLELREDRFPAEWVAYLETQDLPDQIARNLRASAHVASIAQEGPWTRLGFKWPNARESLCQHPESPLAQLGIPTYEGDVDPLRRIVTDRQDVSIARPRRAFLDIETDSRVPPRRAKEGAARVLSWSVISEDGGRRRVRCDVLAADTDPAEAELLGKLFEELRLHDQVLAWSGDDFDFPIIQKRAADRRVAFDWRRVLLVDHLELFRRMNMHASQSGDEKQSMKLQVIAQATLGLGKLEEEGIVPGKALGAQTYEMWAAGGDWRERLVRYMNRDTDLLRQIEKKNGYVSLFGTICEVCRLFGDSRAINPTRQMDGFMLALGRARGHHFPTRRFYDEVSQPEDQFRGAFVMEPKMRGVERGVHVVDFASLYPAIILTWNMSPDTKRAVPVNGPIPEGHCRCPSTGLGFDVTTPGILPSALRELMRLRKEWSDRKASLPPGTPEWYDADRRSMAYKVAANSFYGVLGSVYSRYHDRAVAESVTQNGVWLLKLTLHAMEERGWRALYGDTDSAFCAGPTDDEFAQFTDWCNRELYPEALRKVGCTENAIKLAYEKKFSRVVMVSAKRYIAAFDHYKGKRSTKDSKPEIKGLEYKRGDAAVLARRLQGVVIDLLCGGLKVAPEGVEVPTDDIEQYHAVISRARHHVLEEPLPIEEIVIAKALTQPLRDYAAKKKNDGTDGALPAHVRVAKVLEERGEIVSEGTRVEYVVTDGASSPKVVIPAADYTGAEVDRHYVWEDVVWPPTERLLMAAFPDHDWPSWGKTRPAKRRKKDGDERQLELGAAPAAPALAVPAPPPKKPPPAEELLVHVDEDRVSSLEPLYALLRRHPGQRPVVILLHMRDGATARLSTILKASGSPGLLEELARFSKRTAA